MSTAQPKRSGYDVAPIPFLHDPDATIARCGRYCQTLSRDGALGWAASQGRDAEAELLRFGWNPMVAGMWRHSFVKRIMAAAGHSLTDQVPFVLPIKVGQQRRWWSWL